MGMVVVGGDEDWVWTGQAGMSNCFSLPDEWDLVKVGGLSYFFQGKVGEGEAVLVF